MSARPKARGLTGRTTNLTAQSIGVSKPSERGDIVGGFFFFFDDIIGFFMSFFRGKGGGFVHLRIYMYVHTSNKEKEKTGKI